MTLIDISIVAGRRPDLLQATLNSFHPQVFANFQIGKVLINIDPIFGSLQDGEACVGILRNFYPDAIVFDPQQPNFCGAVKRLWAASQADVLLHMEDDWLALQKIGEEALEAFADADIQQISLHHADQNWDIKAKGQFHKRKNYFKIAGLKLPRFTSFPKFTTSPSFLRGSFARRCSALLIEDYDPEKQFYSAVNPALERMVAGYKNFIYSPSAQPVIRDIGREWRDKRGIFKAINSARSTWSGFEDAKT